MKYATLAQILGRTIVTAATDDLKSLEQDLAQTLKIIEAGELPSVAEAGIFQDVLIGLGMAAALFNAQDAKADATQMHSWLEKFGKEISQTDKNIKVKDNFSKKDGGHGVGNYTVQIGPYLFTGRYDSNDKKTMHHVDMKLNKSAPMEERMKYRGVADQFNELLTNEAEPALHDKGAEQPS